MVLDAARLALRGGPEWARELTGGRYRPSRAAQSCQVVPVIAAGHHPILAGAAPFGCRTPLAGLVELAAGSTVLLRARNGGHTEPAAWACQDLGRVFATTLGAGDECRQPGFLRLLGHAIAWACDP